MKASINPTLAFLDELEKRACRRAIEIDGYIERVTLEDRACTMILAAGRDAGYGKKRKGGKV